jgi:hypothetical protein
MRIETSSPVFNSLSSISLVIPFLRIFSQFFSALSSNLGFLLSGISAGFSSSSLSRLPCLALRLALISFNTSSFNSLILASVLE